MLHASVNSPSRWEEFNKGDCIHKFESTVSYIYFLLFFVLPPLPPAFFFFCISKPYIEIRGDFLGCPIVKDPSSTAGGTGSIPDQGTKIPLATCHGPPKNFFPWNHSTFEQK